MAFTNAGTPCAALLAETAKSADTAPAPAPTGGEDSRYVIIMLSGLGTDTSSQGTPFSSRYASASIGTPKLACELSSDFALTFDSCFA